MRESCGRNASSPTSGDLAPDRVAAHIDLEFEQLARRNCEAGARTTARADASASLQKSLTETTNTLSAYVAEVDDKLNRALRDQ